MNPFALVIMTQLKALETQRNPVDRLRWEIDLLKLSNEKGYTRERFLSILKFLDRMMILPEALELKFNETLISIEENKMPYVTSMERIGCNRRLDNGFKKGCLFVA